VKFSKEFLQEEEGKTISDVIIDQQRWVTVKRRVFEYEGHFYETIYEYGSTEIQDQAPYEYDPDEIECKEVFPVEKVVVVYE